MTNETIILNERLRLLDERVLWSTGGLIELEDGTKVPEPEELHTFQAWKKLGYSVKKGEKAVAKFPIWKFVVTKAKDDADKELQTKNKMFMKTAAFFCSRQVEKI